MLDQLRPHFTELYLVSPNDLHLIRSSCWRLKQGLNVDFKVCLLYTRLLGFRYSRFLSASSCSKTSRKLVVAWQSQTHICSAAHRSRPAELNVAARYSRITYQHSPPSQSTMHTAIA